jgi:hypothetical protein
VTHQTIGAQADGLVLEFFGADLLGIFLRDDPGRPSGGAGIEDQEIRPGRMEVEANMIGVHDLDRFDLFFQLPCLACRREGARSVS